MKKPMWFGAMLLSALVCAALTVPAAALAANDPAVAITVTPDQSEYAKGDTVRFDVKVINHNDYELTDLKLNASVSDILELTENAVYDMKIGAFETKNYTVSAKPAEQKTELSEGQNGGSDVAAPDAGEDLTGLLLTLLLAGGSAVLLFRAAKRKGTRALLSLLLCSAILGSMCPNGMLKAAAAEQASDSGSAQFRYGNQNAVISVRAGYTAADNIIHPDYSGLGTISAFSTYGADAPFGGLSGTLDNSDNVVKFSYENRDAWDTVLCKGEIPVGTEWSVEDIGLIVGVNTVTLTAEQSDGLTFKRIIRITNEKEENMKNLLVDLSDEDGDKLLAYYESIYGTDPAKPDTDGDGISDYEEMFIQNTDPLKADTDNDGLSDGEEVEQYQSDPRLNDTDDDGVSDGDAVAAGLDPTGTEENPTVRTQTVSAELNSTEKPLFKSVSVTMDTAGNLRKHLSVSNTEKADKLSADVVGALSAPIEITSDAAFTSAKISFTYDPALLGDTPAENLAVMWYDKENMNYVIFDQDTVVDTEKHTVSYVTTHFSTYLVVDREIWYDCWRENADYRNGDTSDLSPYDIGFCVDVSGSMYGNSIEKAKTALNTFIDAMLPQDNACIVSFESFATLEAAYGTSKPELRKVVGTLSDRGGTNTDAGLSMTISEMTANGRPEATKIIVMICDGDVNYVQDTVDAAKAASIAVYTINVISGDNTLLQQIADETGGQYYYAATAEDVVRRVEVIGGETVGSVDTTDSDGDGLYDVYESQGIRIQNGRYYKSDPANPDTDGDGLTDYQELGQAPTAFAMEFANGMYSCVLCHAVSDPNTTDTDGDGIMDAEDPDKYIHFGYVELALSFCLANTIDDFEMPDYIKSIKANEDRHEYEVVSQRYSWMLDYPLLGYDRLLTLWLGASLMWEGGAIGDLFLRDVDLGCAILNQLPNVNIVGDYNIDNAAFFLQYYMSNIGGTVGFDATDLVTGTNGGQYYFNSNTRKLKKAFEQALMPGKSCVITTTGDANLTAWTLRGNLTEPNELDTWIALNACNVVITAEGSFDGTDYQATVKYYVVDRYDFYETDEENGHKRVGLIDNDSYVILSYFDMAEPFDVIGYYETTLHWN